MRLLLTSDARFERTPDGAIWGPPACGAALWSRYLDVFSEVVIAARVIDAPEPASGAVAASGPGIVFRPVPTYSGVAGFLRHSRKLRRAVAQYAAASEAVIVRSPSPIANFAAAALMRLGRPYGAEVVGDPHQFFAPGAFRHPIRGAIRRTASAAQARVARHASAALFVTKEFLQRKYPTLGASFAVSDVALDDDAFDVKAPPAPRTSPVFTLVTVGALSQPYKGTAVLIDAMHHLQRSGGRWKLRIVGAGRLMPRLRSKARDLALASNVEFLGQLDQHGVRRTLDEADLFVLPSFQEGLPRALLEAMARGLPAIATNVGGIPELLPPECMVAPGDSAALARRIFEVASNDRLRAAHAARNRQVARDYHDSALRPLRRQFLQAVRQATSTASREAACA